MLVFGSMAQTQIALINEPDCIGCTKCIDVCPTDAIVGATKLMHTVLTDDCIGCKLCIPACPVDCIALLPLPNAFTPLAKEEIKQRHLRRQNRLQSLEAKKQLPIGDELTKKDYLKALMLRVKKK